MSDNRYSDSDSSSGDDELKEFVLVEFIHRGRKKKCESADIVPSKWLEFDNTRKRCLTKFLESPYGPEDIEMLHTLVKEKADAPENWPVYPVEVRGRASTYERAVEKIGTLEKGGNAFTTDDESASEIKSKMHNAVRQKQLKAQAKLLTEKFLPGNKVTNNYSQKNDKESTSESSCGIQRRVDFAVPSTSGIPSRSTNAHETQQPKEATVSINGLRVGNGLHTDNGLRPAQEPVNNLDAVELELNNDDNNENQELHEPIDNLVRQLNIPIVQLGNYESKSDFETLVLTKLNQITLKLDDIITSLKDVQKKQNDTDTFLMDKSVVQHQGKIKIDFLKKYKLKLPIEDMETFKIFDASLTVGDQFLKADVYIELTSLVDELGCITKSFSAMMKRFIAKDVAVQFTAARKARDPTKEQGAGKFKDTALFQCMSVVMVSASIKRNVLVSNKDLIRGLSSIVCGAKKWE
ncbi:uncharacterized protein LOC100679091 isoform X3 [Nasonia vitripennis]|nr:uncharacterized protein LOC100679091 isoform X3 [Nasonia vitripennis]XP_016838669.2 uncharacterized protein LOC100679091 isoform X3 [Nasonia vitripennis]